MRLPRISPLAIAYTCLSLMAAMWAAIIIVNHHQRTVAKASPCPAGMTYIEGGCSQLCAAGKDPMACISDVPTDFNHHYEWNSKLHSWDRKPAVTQVDPGDGKEINADAFWNADVESKQTVSQGSGHFGDYVDDHSAEWNKAHPSKANSPLISTPRFTEPDCSHPDKPLPDSDREYCMGMLQMKQQIKELKSKRAGHHKFKHAYNEGDHVADFLGTVQMDAQVDYNHAGGNHDYDNYWAFEWKRMHGCDPDDTVTICTAKSNPTYHEVDANTQRYLDQLYDIVNGKPDFRASGAQPGAPCIAPFCVSSDPIPHSELVPIYQRTYSCDPGYELWRHVAAHYWTRDYTPAIFIETNREAHDEKVTDNTEVPVDPTLFCRKVTP